MDGLREALLQFPCADERRWLRFSQPIATLVAWAPDQVSDVLTQVEHEAAGHWAVGFVAYHAAPAFDLALQARARPGAARPAFEAAVAQIRHYLAAGDIYQANYTYRLLADFSGDPLGLFADMVRSQRADHGAYLDFGDQVICSASPELFFRRDGRRITCRPMKGTAARQPEPRRDAEAAARLRASSKDRAENLIIVDMVRNDLGRIAEVGTVRVPALCTLEPYPTVYQLTSTIEADTDAGLVDVFRALFPPASITGAPKIRATQIIHQLEPDARGVYTGCLGAISPHGVIEFNVAIRTAVVDRAHDRIAYGVGCGIVWDSDPAAEWEESVAKTRMLTERRPPFDLFETMRYEPGRGVLLFTRHLERLERSARYFGFVFDRERIRRALADRRFDEPKRLRLCCAAGGSFEIEVRDVDAPAAAPWTLPLVPAAVRSDDVFLYHKTTNRAVFDTARARHPGAPDVILLNQRGEVTETTLGNILVEIDGRLFTPPLSCGLLPGTQRAELLAAGRIVERVLTADDLRAAARLWMVNSVRGWVEIELIEDAPAPDRLMPRSRRRAGRVGGIAKVP